MEELSGGHHEEQDRYDEQQRRLDEAGPGVAAGLLPLALTLVAMRVGYMCVGEHCSTWCLVACVVGGIYVLPGPTIGAIITILLAETLRIFFGTGALGYDNLVYGTLLVVFIIFLPQGLVGAAWNRLTGARRIA